MGNAAWFWDRMAARYARTPVANEEAYQKKLEVTRGYLDPQSTVFEFGCGTGSTAISHAEHVGQILAVDSSGRMIDIARDKASAAGVENVEFRKGDIDDFSGGAQHFDVVLGLNILHLLDDWRGAIKRSNELLKPGGVFVSSTACIGDMPLIWRLLAPVMRLLPLLPGIRTFSAAELLEALKASDFTVEYQWQPGAGGAVFIVARKSG